MPRSHRPDPCESVQFAVLGYAIRMMETETYRPSRIILLGEDASQDLRRETSLDKLVTAQSPPFFLWHTAEDIYVPTEHTYRLAAALAAHDVPHPVHVFAHGSHGLGLAQGAGAATAWTTCAASWSPNRSTLPTESPRQSHHDRVTPNSHR
ncbi:alpha/beta hydrolase family protein [Streptomyces sp. NPDC091259]|uniref:alpha/beta hydrolase family protein n=1 Tax=Streptomyces sp. NPDC091259 TaxID=3365976 RepID=UPI00382B940A